MRAVTHQASSRRARLLFVGEAVSLAHVGRPALLARWAQAAGYDVLFACGAKCADMARQEGLLTLPVPTIAAAAFHDRLAWGKFFYTGEEIDDYVRAELGLLREFQPDLVVGDFRLSLAISTALTRTPLLSLCNAYWSPAAPCRFVPPQNGLLGCLPDALGQTLFAAIRPLAFRFFARPLDQARCRWGLPPVQDFREHYTAGRWCAYLDLPGWVPLGPLPKGHFSLGPVIWQPRSAASPVDRLARDRPLAYVALGNPGAGAVLVRILQAMTKLGCECAVSGVGPADQATLDQHLPEWRCRAYAGRLLNPEDVLQRSAVTVCHGGSGTIYQSLAAGVPVLCLPGNTDQQLASAALIAHGAGLALPRHRATAPRLERLLTELLHTPDYRQAAHRVSCQLAQYDTRQRWLRFLAQRFSISLSTSPCSDRAATLALA